MLSKLLQFVRKHRLIQAGDRVGIAVSGGADSVALLRALLEVRDELGCILSVVHLHHSLRGADADADLAFVQELTAQHHLEFHVERRDVAALATANKLSIEAAGRRARLEFFAGLQAHGLLDKIATAHTANDQAETVLLKFLRGAGTRGLAGIYPYSEQSGATLIRPMLDHTRVEVEQFLHDLKQPWREDATNRSPEFLRNRVRHELLPLLEHDFNPSILESLSSSAELAREEQQFWDTTVASALQEIQLPNEMFDAARFRLLHVALQRRVLIAVVESPLDFAHIERSREFIVAGQVGEREIARGSRIKLVRDSAGRQVFALTSGEPAAGTYSLELALPGAVELPEPRCSTLVARIGQAERPGSGLNPGLVGRTLTIRNWNPGDRFQPFGRGEGKVKDFFQQIHVPASARATWPVGELDGEIVWVLGLPVASRFAAKDATAIVLEEVPSTRLPASVVEDVTSQDAARSRK